LLAALFGEIRVAKQEIREWIRVMAQMNSAHPAALIRGNSAGRQQS
jgi:hypothetical protein